MERPTFACATNLGSGGISVFVLQGAPTSALISALPAIAAVRPGQIVRGWLRRPPAASAAESAPASGEEKIVDEVLLARLSTSAGESYLLTGHGGTACAREIRSALLSAAYREILPDDTGAAAAGITGSGSSNNDGEKRRWHETAVKNSALHLFGIWGGLSALCRTQRAAYTVAAACARNDLESVAEILTMLRPRRIVLAGAPNAGKSSLFNRLLAQEQALVSPIPGTTRDAVSCFSDIEGFYCEIIDTAGIRPGGGALENEAQSRGLAMLDTADAILWVTAADHLPDSGDQTLAARIAAARRPVIAVINKDDLPSAAAGRPGINTFIAASFPAAAIAVTSCRCETGLQTLREHIGAILSASQF